MMLDSQRPAPPPMSSNAQGLTPRASVLSQASKLVHGAGRAVVLLGRSNPKLLVPDVSARQRWRLSAFYPAFKLKAKCWRLLQRARCVVRLAQIVPVQDADALIRFVDDVLPGFTHSSVLVGTSGPDQKIIAQLWHGAQVVAYLKVAAAKTADRKIVAEAEILEKLPEGSGPRLLKSGVLNGRAALLLSPVAGKMLSAELPKASEARGQMSEIRTYLEQLIVSEEKCEVDEHPAIVRLCEQVTGLSSLSSVLSLQDFEEILAPLRTQKWPVVIQHGDFAPWNVLRTLADRGQRTEVGRSLVGGHPSSGLCAIDWEEGCLDGFSYFDLIHYVSQTAALVEKSSPDKCTRYLLDYLAELSAPVRKSVIKLGLLASWLILKRTLDGDHWILGWKADAWRAIDEL